MRRSVLVLTAAVAASLALTACSGGSSGSGGSGGSAKGSGGSPTSARAVDALALVKQAGQAGQALTSAHLESTTTLAGKTTTVVGDVTYHPVALQESVNIAGQSVREVLVGKTFYLQIPGGALGKKPWVSISVAQMSKLVGIDLTSLLDKSRPDQTVDLLSQAGDLKAVGTEQVDGATTQHLSGTVDLNKAMAAMTASSPGYASIQSMVKSAGIKDTHIDLWVNAQKIPVKFVETYTSSLGAGTTTMHLTKLNQPAHITAPPAAETQKFTG